MALWHRSLAVRGVAFLVVAVSMTEPAHAAADPKVVNKCQATVKKAGAKFIGKKLGALAKCADGVFKCIQTVDETSDAGAKRTACITKARAGCLKSLAATSAARQAFVAGVTGVCATLDAAQVTGGSGLGYAGTDCAEFGAAPITSVATLAECVATEHDCLASRLFQLSVPRALELLQFTPPPAVTPPPGDLARLTCLDDHGGTGADVGDVVLGKSIVKCQKAIEKVATKLAGGRLKTLEKCVDALFVCAQTKTGEALAACRSKARAGCEKAFAKLSQQSTALGASVAKPCGDGTLFTAFRAPSGANLDALVPLTMLRAALGDGCTTVASLADYAQCLVTRNAELVDDLLRFQAPRAESLLGAVGCELGSCGPAPQPTSTPTGGGGPVVTKILDFDGDGDRGCLSPRGIAAGGDGTAYVACNDTDNAFKITANGTVTQILGNTQGQPPIAGNIGPIAADGDAAYVTTSLLVSPGERSGTVHKIVGNDRTVILDTAGDGVHPFKIPQGVGVDASHDVYAVATNGSVFRVTPQGGITAVLTLDSNGSDGQGHTIGGPYEFAVSPAGVVYLAVDDGDKAFKISGGVVTQIIGPNGDGTNPFNDPDGIAADANGNAFVTSAGGVFKITAGGTVTRIMSLTGDGVHNAIGTSAIATDAAGNVYVAAATSNNAFRITPGGAITQIIDKKGDGVFELIKPLAIAVDAAGDNVYVAGFDSNDAFRITLGD